MATQIKSFGKSRMTIGSCSEFHNNALDLITKTTPAELHIETLEPAYSQAVGQLAGIVNRQRAYISTSSLSEADETRDRAIGVIMSVVNAFKTTPVADKRTAAMTLAPQLSPYKGIGEHEYTKQTAETRGMLALLDQEDNAAAIATLGLTEEVEALREANAAFEEKFQTRTAEVSTRMAQSDVKSDDAVAMANAWYEQITAKVNAYALIQPSDEINTFVNDVNGVVGAFSQIAGTRAKGQATTGGDTTKPGTDSGTNPGGGSGSGGSDDDDDFQLG